jgi:hypothetical protein
MIDCSLTRVLEMGCRSITAAIAMTAITAAKIHKATEYDLGCGISLLEGAISSP